MIRTEPYFFAESVQVRYRTPHVSGKRNLNRYLRAHAKEQALAAAAQEAQVEKAAAFGALTGGDLSRARALVGLVGP